MNQIKIGRFIADCRKQKGLTQNQLAEKLGITDKAVSKWENGKSMPDVSLFTSLCDSLGITLNELLAGEHIPDEVLKEKSEEVLMGVIKSKRSIGVIQIIGSILMGVGITLFFIPAIKNLGSATGMGMVGIGLLLLVAGLYCKIKYNHAEL
ncbi:helix-turn-helix domain-containing protein [Clostridium tyrobutyricum]|jgi:transcriptional regulator with XRE-family HTH domain|uniref:helix-turn-helix domain-containing protein n=1 Tax=Clostridium tyrobutyricum TaxID=1519 RepID=UPI000E84948D|nr:helix-turn-helix transcriptional regulator [Clostridium tyrobutyricum]HBN28276.1 XRE family transcriptional regulator [Clostridiaceae bacterium]